MSFKEKLVGFGVLDRRLTNSERWLSFFSMFFFCGLMMYNTMRLSPVLTDVGAVYGMSLSSAGLLISAYSIAGIAFAYPGAWIMRTFGVKSSLLISALITIVGTILGMVVTSAPLLLFSRVLEGCACGLATVIVPNTITRIFPQEKLGLVMGIWGLWSLPGLMLSFATTPVLFQNFGYHALWVFPLILEAALTLWMFFCVKLPAVSENVKPAEAEGEKPVYRHVYLKSAIAIAITMAFWALIYGVVNGFYPTYLQEVKGMELGIASAVPLLLSCVTVPFCIWFGVIAGKHHCLKWFLVVPYAILAVLYFTIAFTPGPDATPAWIFAIAIGICAGGVPMATYAIVPILAEEPKKADYCTATVGFCLQLGTTIAGLFSMPIAALGYTAVSQYILAPIALLGAIVALVSVGDKRAFRERGLE